MLDILKQINGAAMRGNPRLQQIKNVMNTIRGARNPQAALMSMMGNNPQMQQVQNIIQQHGGDPMQAFRAMAEENGLDPDEILSMIR